MTRLFKAHRPRAAKAAAEPASRRGMAEPQTADKPMSATAAGKAGATRVKEIGGPSGPEPTRYGDWERNGICVDF